MSFDLTGRKSSSTTIAKMNSLLMQAQGLDLIDETYGGEEVGGARKVIDVEGALKTYNDILGAILKVGERAANETSSKRNERRAKRASHN